MPGFSGELGASVAGEPLVRSQTTRVVATSLGRHIAKHNRHVLGLTFLSAALSAAVWAIVYAVVYWLYLLGATVYAAFFTNGEMTPPGSYRLIFGAVAFALVVSAWFDHVSVPDERPPDHRLKSEIFLDILLAVPRTTIAIWGNISAWQSLSREQLELAAALIERVLREKRVPLRSTPLDIPDDRSRDKIVFALLMLRILEVEQEDGEARLRLSPFRPESLHLPNPRTLRG